MAETTDIEAAARRIVAVLTKVEIPAEIEADRKAIGDRCRALYGINKDICAALDRARTEFVARVLAEMGPPKAPAAILLLEHDEPDACTADAHAFESADDPASVRLEDEARAADRMSQLAFVRHWTWHPASTRPADGGTP